MAADIRGAFNLDGDWLPNQIMAAGTSAMLFDLSILDSAGLGVVPCVVQADETSDGAVLRLSGEAVEQVVSGYDFEDALDQLRSNLESSGLLGCAIEFDVMLCELHDSSNEQWSFVLHR